MGDGVRWELEGGRVGLGAEVSGDMSGDVLEDAGCLCFAKKAGGEIVKGVVPADHDVGCQGFVEFELVEARRHVGFGEVYVGSEVVEEVVDAFVGDVGVLGGEVDVAGVDEEAESIRLLLEGEGKDGDGGAPLGDAGGIIGKEDLGAAEGGDFLSDNRGVGVGGGVIGEVEGFGGGRPLWAVALGEEATDIGGGLGLCELVN